ncbi:TPA: ABC transporter permease [Candidatus Bipolaricaulota bacterium]|nr:ABC transporter permease [Candidatus Bipolaricaulota bacterium]
MTNLRAIWARAYVRIVGANRELSWLFFDTFLPLLSTAAYVFIYKAMAAPPEFTGYVILGGAMTAYWLNVLWNMASQFYWEKERGQLELFLIAPASPMAILLGMALGGMFMTTVRAGSVLILGSLIFRVRFTVQEPMLLASIFFLTMAALYGLGMLFASLFMLWGREAWHLSSLLQEPVYLASGFYFPVRGLGFWVAAAASLIPLTLGLDAMRQLAFGGSGEGWGFIPPEWEAGLLALLASGFIYFARRALRFMEELGKREGRLTLRWQ